MFLQFLVFLADHMVLVASSMDLIDLLFSKKVYQILKTCNLAINFGDKSLDYNLIENFMAYVIIIIQNDQTENYLA